MPHSTNDIAEILEKNGNSFHNIFPFSLNEKNTIPIDLSDKNRELKKVNYNDLPQLSDFIFGKIKSRNALAAIGGYGEKRIFYQRSELYSQGGKIRNIHLGIDIWSKEGTEIFSPLDAVVHSFADNDSFGNYGPTIILQHQLEGKIFFTLYGHLSKESLSGMEQNKKVAGGELVGFTGNSKENGNWPPHLHFQIIVDLLGNKGDFPGVCAEEEKDFYLNNCPNPMFLLNLK